MPTEELRYNRKNQKSRQVTNNPLLVPLPLRVEPVLGDGLIILRDCHLGPRMRLAFQFMFHWSLSGKKQLAETFFIFYKFIISPTSFDSDK